MYCRYCGKELSEDQRFCPSCGKPVSDEQPGQNAENPGNPGYQGNPNYQGNPGYPGYQAGYDPYRGYPPYYDDQPNAGWGVLGFFFPLIGFILYLVWQTQYPNRSRMCGKGALIGFIVGVCLVILYVILIIVLVAIAASTAPYGEPIPM